ncbi:MAG: hypothetical protein F6K09_17680 [Merismopedia sp. SIO2A8]|nr:hypothetical protein [Merismopedia sp. SIO2A8]
METKMVNRKNGNSKDDNAPSEYLTDEKVEEILKEAEEKEAYLKSRWETQEMQTALSQVVLAIQSNRPWSDFLLKLPDIEEVFSGRDLRGAPLE